MTDEYARRYRLDMVQSQSDWIVEFRIKDFVNNPPYIRKLNEERLFAIAQVIDLEKKLNESTEVIRVLSIENSKMETRLNEVIERGRGILIISIITTLFVGIGVNLATSSPDDWTGWFIILASVGIEIAIVLMRPKAKYEKQS